jgi:hypothetical protein
MIMNTYYNYLIYHHNKSLVQHNWVEVNPS